MFGENDGGGESPRLPSPWQALSTSASNLISPSPLALRSPEISNPGTPNLNHNISTSPAYNGLLGFEFESLSLNQNNLEGNTIDAEVDKSGHIEYKLKLPSPSPLRLAKLTTQLKWRLVEGGGMALYELGVLDNGLIIGLSLEEMNESLETLGKMLGGLGGGEIKIVRVIKVGEDDADVTNGRRKKDGGVGEEGGSDSGGESSDGASTSTSSTSSSNQIFHSFIVDELPPEIISLSLARTEHSNGLSNQQNSKFQSSTSITDSTITSTIKKSSKHTRTPEEKIAFRIMKKEERRVRKELELDLDPTLPIPSRFPTKSKLPNYNNHNKKDYTQIDLDRAAWRLNHPKPSKPPLPRIPVPPKVLPIGMKYKPEMGVKEGQIRYAIEAAVFKKSGLNGLRRTSTTIRGEYDELDEDELALLEGREEEEDEGWSHLEFDRI